MTNGLKQIRVSNYQSIKDAVIDLGAITVITGKTDSGKSALFRAVRGLVNNQSGDDFTTVGEKRTVVAVDGVQWIQSKTENSYVVGEQRWDKCGRDVPAGVRDSINMYAVEFSDGVSRNLNFSGQHDPAFIVGDNPADNAKIIGSISNLHIIYNAIREAEKDTKATKQSMTRITEQKELTLQKLHEDQKALKALNDKHDAMKAVYDKAVEIEAEIVTLRALSCKFNDIDVKIEAYSAKVKSYKSIDIDSMRGNVDYIMRVSGLSDKYIQSDRAIRACRLAVDAYGAIEFDKGISACSEITRLVMASNRLKDIGDSIAKASRYKAMDIDEVLDNVLVIEKLQKHCHIYDTVMSAIETANVSIKKTSSDIKMVAAELLKYDVCDVCGAEKQHWSKELHV